MKIVRTLSPCETLLQYAQDITSGVIMAGAYRKLVCQRFLDDLQNGVQFNDEAAEGLLILCRHIPR